MPLARCGKKVSHLTPYPLSADSDRENKQTAHGGEGVRDLGDGGALLPHPPEITFPSPCGLLSAPGAVSCTGSPSGMLHEGLG